MAITRNDVKWNAETKSYDILSTQVLAEGRVLRVYNSDYRAMSDVYTYATFADLIQDDGSVKQALVNANFECDVSGGRAEVDANEHYLNLHEGWKLVQENLRREQAELDRIARLEVERNRPVVGKKMIVTKGRKVKVGTCGTVAFIHRNTGSILLKDDDKWQDRSANGVWVNPEYLKAR